MIGTGLISAGLGALTWSLVEAQSFTVRTATVPVLPPGASPLRVLHLSDTHLVPSQHRKQEWIRQLAELEPDLVVMTGDALGGHGGITAVRYAFEPLLTVPGVFVFGSNDYFAPMPKNPLRYFWQRTPQDTPNASNLPAEDLAEHWREAGWVDLRNARTELELRGTRITAVGVDDPHIDRDRLPAPDGGSGDTGGGHLHLGVTHSPYTRVLDAMVADGADLVLAGHTHGGQVCLPGVGALVTNCDIDRGRASGLHGWPGPRPDAPGGDDSAWLHVSAGLGTSPYAPIRLACRPEATLLVLTAQSS